MREYWRSSLFLYEIGEEDDGTPIIVFWRATAFTFGKAAHKRTLKKALKEYADTNYLYTWKQLPEWLQEGVKDESVRQVNSWEKRQVPASDSKGLGFGWIEVSRGEKRGLRIEPEKHVAVWNLYAYEKNNARLGYAEFLGKASAYGKDKSARLSLGRVVKSFWEWLTH